MNPTALLTVYCLLIILGSLFGAYVPFFGKVTHGRLQFYLSLSAGVMLGASFFHVMPEAFKQAGSLFGWWMALGVVGLFCIERFIAPHSHELDGGSGHHHHHHHEHGKHDHSEPGHTHEHNPSTPQRAAAPALSGWMAVVGLTIHTFMNGVGLAGQVDAEGGGLSATKVILPGLSMFLAIVLHKPADALAISTVLSRKGVQRQKIGLVQLGFACMVPVGVIAFRLISGFEKQLENHLIGAALAFSAGTFLFIALSDLLPEVQFHRHDRVPLFLALLGGVLLMGFIAWLEDMSKTEEPTEEEHAAIGCVHVPHAWSRFGEPNDPWNCRLSRTS